MESATTCYAWVVTRVNLSADFSYFGVLGSDGFLSIERYPAPGIVAQTWMPGMDKDRDHVLELHVRPEVREGDEGVALEFRAWEEGTDRPETPTLETWDTHPLPAGFPGLGMSMFADGVSGTATFRDFSATWDPPLPACVSIYDDFDDGALLDGDPVEWTHRSNQGAYDASSGDLCVSGTVNTLWAGPVAVFSGRETLRTQMRMESAATCYGWVFTRANLNTGASYFAVLGSDGFLSIERYPDPGIVAQSSMQVETDRDYIIELDLRPEVREGDEGVALEFRVWDAETERPALPSLQYWDADPVPEGFPGLGMSMFAGGVPGSTTFRYFSATSCPAPAAAMDISSESGVAPLEIIADGSGSSAPEGRQIAKYDWDFGDGETGTGMTASHTYASGGLYWIRLMVTDDQGATATALESIRVSCPPQDMSPWVYADIGDPPWSGSAWLDGEGLQVCAAGAGFTSRSDEGFFLFQEVSGDFRITARVVGLDAATAFHRAGLMIRDSLEPDARVATALVQASTIPDGRRVRVYQRKEPGDLMRTVTLTPTLSGETYWVRLERRGLDEVIASASSDPDGGVWSSVEIPFDSPLPSTVLVGIAACHGVSTTTGSEAARRATFTDLDLVTESLAFFKRGDANGDGEMQISDPVFILMHIFSEGRAPTCLEAADVNDNGVLDLSDPVFGLDYLFASGPEPPPPFSECGADPTEDDLGCEAYSPCEHR
ncbi:MAG: PKD domain-containing protein [Planctomycetes bacterium]|nr:PKD domain-containing protein [Planctomycetota bacterium]